MSGGGVVLLHGILRSRRSMHGLARLLADNGYKTLNLGYPSSRQSIEAIADAIRPPIAAFAQSLQGKVHFIGHSMGGLVIRCYLHRSRPQNLGRVVLLGTPNKGSEVADFLKDRWAYKWLFGPAGQQLVTGSQTANELFGKVDYDLGIIAGNRSIDPISSWIIGLPNDGRVSIESSKAPGMKDHAVVPVAHAFLPINYNVRRLALKFLHEGGFS